MAGQHSERSTLKFTLFVLMLAVPCAFILFLWRMRLEAPSLRAAPSASRTPRPAPITSKEGELTAHEILTRMKDAYAACSTYADRGICRTEFLGSEGFTNRLVFKIAFVRPDHFRFEHRTNPLPDVRTWEPNIVLKIGDDIRAKWSFKAQQEKCESLELAVAGATGISSGTAHMTPRMLLPDMITGRMLSDLPNPSLLPPESVHGRPCHRVESQWGKGEFETLWIDQETFMLLKHVEVTARPRVIQTTTFSPVLDESIDEAEFRFRPPDPMNETIFKQLQAEADKGNAG